MWIVRFAGIASLAASAVAAPLRSVDSQRGERVFQSEACVQCHSVEGKGGKTAPDLGKRIDRNYTPASLVSVMWNHAPTMWAAMERQGIRTPALDEQGAADLFAYFYAVRFFDKPGDAARGKRLFSSKHCSECHGITGLKAEEAKPVIRWESLGHPIRLAEAMWNHAANMRHAFADQKVAWPEITGRTSQTFWSICAICRQRVNSARAWKPAPARTGGRCSSRRVASSATRGSWRWRRD